MSRIGGGAIPKPSEKARAAFTKLVPDEPAVTLRPMFGNLSAFVNGNMFSGLFGDDLFVRLPDDQSAQVRKLGGRDFEVMPGRAMKGYVIVPKTWRAKPDAAARWIEMSMAFTRKMPPKALGGTKTPTKKTAARKRP
jgi:TfoX/Sxy family transcriptional regulator of competence genes